LHLHQSSVTKETVRKDVIDFIDKVKRGENLEDMPVMINVKEHEQTLLALNNRLTVLQMDLRFQKNLSNGYERFLQAIQNAQYGMGHLPHSIPFVYINNGEVNSRDYLIANDSSKIIQGDKNQVKEQFDYSSKIKIGNSFNERSQQVTKIDEIVDLLYTENIDSKIKQEILSNIFKLKEEITECETPEKNKIYKWLEKIKNLGGGVIYSHHLAEAFEWLHKSFNFFNQHTY
jgi:hypothetical protein